MAAGTHPIAFVHSGYKANQPRLTKAIYCLASS